MKIIRPEETRQWLQSLAAQALREAHDDQRRKDFRETFERIKRMSNLTELLKQRRERANRS
ncbi:hypothetical protein [Nostoc sp.]|uniref:hypothetical protein n=1 Tax=Nostoc sp. TaxID=1180 RepID=UPI002FFB6252